ncbi:tryptophan 2,3-dioxygenase [Nocardia sp. NPDC052278]|uniref:tryptophan 2,3-dioxygenase n=1 Tax=unclassified Nocardia TaxID=2637762 RepID=UPI00369A116B
MNSDRMRPHGYGTPVSCPFSDNQTRYGAPPIPSCAGEPVGHDNASLDFPNAMSYSDYLSLGAILSAQHPLSPDPNELLFIIQHQTTELWIKLVLHELTVALEAIHRDELPSASKVLARVLRIFEHLVQAWNVLATLTPSEYSVIRPYLAQSSGFQSYQYRKLEFLLGNKNSKLLRSHAHCPQVLEQVRAMLDAPSLYDEVILLLAQRGFPITPARLERDWAQPPQRDQTVEDAWIEVYRNPQKHWDLYAMAEQLVDLEDIFRQWRFRHVTTVERIIGFKQGTGGTSGVPYLRKVLDVTLFPELWHMRTIL